MQIDGSKIVRKVASVTALAVTASSPVASLLLHAACDFNPVDIAPGWSTHMSKDVIAAATRRARGRSRRPKLLQACAVRDKQKAIIASVVADPVELPVDAVVAVLGAQE